MKLLFPTVSFIFTASASFTEMEDAFEKIMNNNSAHDRAFAGNQFSLSLRFAESYGCWCHSLEEHTGKGKSKPVDALDSLCKRLSEGYDCASIDADAQGLTCNAWEEDYSDGNGNALGCGTLKTADDVAGIDANTLLALGIEVVSDCKKQACLIEQDFVNKVAALFLGDPNAANPDYKHDNVNFDQEASCITKQCTGTFCDSDRQCCGDVPGRRTFKTKSEAGVDRECCGDTVYLDNGIMQCCTDAGTGLQILGGTGTCP